jgi:predicted N-acetyltransferase YhbS
VGVVKQQIRFWVAGAMIESQFVAACALHHAAFPRPGRTLADVMEKKRPVWMGPDVVPGPLRSECAPRRLVVIGPRGQVLGNVGLIARQIETPAGLMRVQGILDVASSDEARGLGLGRRLIRAAWDEVDAGLYPLCLFQTGPAVGYYERLGARVVDNEFFDSTGDTPEGQRPFTDEAVMIYPADADWPAGPIDLRGPGW